LAIGAKRLNLGRNKRFSARPPAEGKSNDALGLTVLPRRVDEVDTQFQCPVESRNEVVFGVFTEPASEPHGAETESADWLAGSGKLRILHDSSLVSRTQQ